MISRRDFLRKTGETSLAITAAAATGIRTSSTEPVERDQLGEAGRTRRAFEIRCDRARDDTREGSGIVTNGDEERYPDRRGSFSKTLPHNDLGEVDISAYADWLSLLAAGEFDRLDQIRRDLQAEAKLNNPQAAYAFDLVGLDSHATHLAPPPAFASGRMAVEMAELYWQALVIDVPFRNYETSILIRDAVSDINAFSAPLSSPSSQKITAKTLFRGETAGDLAGPYISQFLWLDIPYGLKTIDQRYRCPARSQSFLVDTTEWLACQRGASPRKKLWFESTPRYICSNRELAEYVHRDFSFQSYLNAALIMLQFGDQALSPTNPYLGAKAQFGDITFGGKNILSMVAQAALLGQKSSFYHKWLVHRRLRPESFAGRIEMHLSGRKFYDIDSQILNCDAVNRIQAANDSRLLPVAFPEGSPTHPSYPAAHACTAGACVTILKGFFNEDFPLTDPVEATADGSALTPWKGESLTLGNEINKLGNNIALGRDAAGVHFRSDSINGLFLGEEQALCLLCDYSRTYYERFDGFVLTTLNGEKVRILNGELERV